ncbi:hypothetical protein [EBPR siphovirus 2]|nr:hypothetical protein [EBPR siphovirus 2]
MTDDLAVALRAASPKLRGLTLWKSHRGWQANYQRDGSTGWIVAFNEDPVLALLEALGQKPPAPKPKSVFD